MGIGSIFVSGIACWSKHFLLLTAVYMIPKLLAGLLSGIINKVYIQSLTFPVYKVLAQALVGLGINFPAMLWGIVALLVTLASCSGANTLRIGGVMAETRRRFWPYVAAFAALMGIAVACFLALAFGIFCIAFLFQPLGAGAKIALGACGALLVIGAVSCGVHFGLRLSLSTVVAVADTRLPVRPLRRSYALTEKYIPQTLGVMFLLSAISIFFVIPMVVLGALGHHSRLFTLLSRFYYMASSFISVPLAISVLFMLYKYITDAESKTNVHT